MSESLQPVEVGSLVAADQETYSNHIATQVRAMVGSVPLMFDLPPDATREQIIESACETLDVMTAQFQVEFSYRQSLQNRLEIKRLEGELYA